MADPWLSSGKHYASDPTSAHEETIALLEEEIARLEGELRLRDLDAAEAHGGPAQPAAPQRDAEAWERIARLDQEVAIREETIALLLEQVRLADEAQAASQAEWEQLHQWVQEVEHRVAQNRESGTDLRDELATERRNADTLRQNAEKDRRAWDTQRQALVAEVERLRSRFTEVASGSDTSTAAVLALEHETQELREAYDALVRTAIPAHEFEAMAQENTALRQQVDTLQHELQRLRDEHKRERNEHEASLNSLRSQLARESLRRQEEHVKTSVTQASHHDKEILLEADIRIRALREHLKEIHRDETDQKMRRGLAARLTRLWHHTGHDR